jgi:hypothetical protein
LHLLGLHLPHKEQRTGERARQGTEAQWQRRRTARRQVKPS